MPSIIDVKKTLAWGESRFPARLLGEGDTVLAPAGVKHGFENRSGATARLLAIFPKTQFERVPME